MGAHPSSLSIVLPTYNEKENLQIFIPAIQESFKAIDYEILVVDDNSPDGTPEFVTALSRKFPNIKLVLRDKKEGIGAALKTGYDLAQKEIILSSDADLSFSSSDMFRLYEKMEEGYDMVIGSRHSQGGFYESRRINTKFKYLASRLGNIVLRLLSGIRLSDFSANFRAIRKTSWNLIKTKERTNVILFEMIVKAKAAGIRITEIPVAFKERAYGKSKLNLGFEVLRFIIKLIFLPLNK